MDRKIRVRVFDNRAKKFIELGCFPDAKVDEVAVRGAIFYEDLDPAVLSLYSILDADCEERDRAEFEYSDFSFSQFTGKYDDDQTPIFENDFVKVDGSCVGEVLFNDDSAAFEVFFFDGKVSGFGALNGKSILVTGNRFEIPEVQVR
jgi:yopX protein